MLDDDFLSTYEKWAGCNNKIPGLSSSKTVMKTILSDLEGPFNTFDLFHFLAKFFHFLTKNMNKNNNKKAGYHRHIFAPPTIKKMPFRWMKAFFCEKVIQQQIFDFYLNLIFSIFFCQKN